MQFKFQVLFHLLIFHFAENMDLKKFSYQKVVYKMRYRPGRHGYLINNYLFIKYWVRVDRPGNIMCKVKCQHTGKKCQVAGFIDKTSNQAFLWRDMVHSHPPDSIVDCSDEEAEITTVSNGKC